MRKAPLSLLLMATVAFVSNAEAKNRDKSWEFGLMLGNVDGDRRADVGNGLSGGLRFGYNFSSKVTTELWISDEGAEQGNVPDFLDVALSAIPEEICSENVGPSDPDCAFAIFESSLNPDVDKDVRFRRAIFSITGNFLTDRETRTIPFISAGLGVIQETRADYPVPVTYVVSTDHDNDPSTQRVDQARSVRGEVLESFDASAIVMISVGARTFFSDNWGARYEVGFMHHDSFQEGQDEYLVNVGVTWVVGGQK